MNILLSLLQTMDLINSYTILSYNFIINNYSCVRFKKLEPRRSFKKSRELDNTEIEGVFKSSFVDSFNNLKPIERKSSFDQLSNLKKIEIVENGNKRNSITIDTKDLILDSADSKLKISDKKSRKDKETVINPTNMVENEGSHILGNAGRFKFYKTKRYLIKTTNANGDIEAQEINVESSKGCNMGIHIYSKAARFLCKKIASIAEKRFQRKTKSYNLPQFE